MCVSVLVVANHFLTISDEPISNLRLQNLVYKAQGFCFGFHDKPIYYDETLAYSFGPVVPTLYRSLQRYGNGVVSEQLPLNDIQKTEIISESERELIQSIYSAYKKFDNTSLQFTVKRGPWETTWNENKFGVISHETIRNYFSELVSDRLSV